jgi:hypothetical protein
MKMKKQEKNNFSYKLLLFYLLLSNGNALQEPEFSTTLKCKNPSIIELEMMLLEFEIQSVNHIFLMNEEESKKALTSHTNNQSILNKLLVEFVPPCSQAYTIEINKNYYPFKSKKLECNTNKLFKNSQIVCYPIFEVKAYLERKECDPNTNVYKWEPVFRKQIVSCGYSI